MKKDIIYLDFESYSEFDIRKYGAWAYSKHPSTEILCMAFAKNDDPVQIWIPGETEPPAFVFDKDGDFIVEAHNASFEMSIWQNICVPRLGWAPLPVERWEDSMVKCAIHALPLSLDKAGAALNLDVQKDKEGSLIMMQIAKPRKPSKHLPYPRILKGICDEWDEKYEKLYAYCIDDVRTERELSKALEGFEQGDLEWQVWKNNQDLNLRGVPINMKAVEAALKIEREYKEWADAHATELTDGEVGSLRQVAMLKVWLTKNYPDYVPKEFAESLLNALVSSANMLTGNKVKPEQIPGDEAQDKIQYLLLSEAPVFVTEEESKPLGELLGKVFTDWKDPDTFQSPLKLDKATLKSLLADPNIPDHVAEAVKLRQGVGKSSVSKIHTMFGAADPDDSKVRWTIQYHGASTGREGGRLIQPQNMPKPLDYIFELAQERHGLTKHDDPTEKLIEDIQSLHMTELMEIYGNPMDAVSSALRGFISAPEGYVLRAFDYNAIEPRVLFWGAGQDDALDLYRTGADIYCETASYIYRKAITKDDHPKERQLGKATVLGCGYGMGAAKFQATVESQGDIITTAMSVTAVKAYRERFSMVPELWKEVEETAINCLLSGKRQEFRCGAWEYNKETRFLMMVLPSGRCLYYYHPLLTKVETPWGEKRWQITFMGVDSRTKKWKRETTWGGTLVENWTQAVARDIMCHFGEINLTNAGYGIIMKVHDELVSLDKEGFGSLEEMETLLLKLDGWAKDIPIAVEGWEGKTYRK